MLSELNLFLNRFKYWLPSLILMILIFIGSDDPVSGEKSDFITRFIWNTISFINGIKSSPEQEAATAFVIRKLAHIFEYLVLTLSYYYAISNTYKYSGNSKKMYLIPFLLCFFYAISDEYHQTFIPGRVGTYKDVLIDSVGILTAYLFHNLKLFRKNE